MDLDRIRRLQQLVVVGERCVCAPCLALAYIAGVSTAMLFTLALF